MQIVTIFTRFYFSDCSQYSSYAFLKDGSNCVRLTPPPHPPLLLFLTLRLQIKCSRTREVTVGGIKRSLGLLSKAKVFYKSEKRSYACTRVSFFFFFFSVEDGGGASTQGLLTVNNPCSTVIYM